MSDTGSNATPVDEIAVSTIQNSPLAESRDSVLGCEFCGYSRLRRSRVAIADVFEILRLRYPMRCMRCSERQYHDVTFAFLSKARSKRLFPEEPGDAWQSWTKSSPEMPLSTRPMSTAMGTRAERLTKPVSAPATMPGEDAD